MKKTICKFCGREITNCNLNKHLMAHEKGTILDRSVQSVKHDSLNCVYCGKLCKNKNSLAQHECRCKENPNHYLIPPTVFGNANGKSHPAWNKGLTKATDERVKKYGLSNKAKYESGEHKIWCQGKKLPEEMKNKISNTCLARSKAGTWHKSLAKDMHHKYKGIDLDGSWEVKYAQWLDKNNIKWVRPNERFEYLLDGEIHYYTPDFYLIETEEYVEVKGFKTAKDEAKWKYFPKNKLLKILFEKDLKDLGII